MAVPDRLAEWQALMARPDPQPPPRVTYAELDRLTERQRQSYDEQRVRWLSADVVFATPDIVELTRSSRIVLTRNRVASSTANRALAISGSSTLGKSTATIHLARLHHHRTPRGKLGRRQHPNQSQGVVEPVIYVVVPAAATPKMLMMAFARFLGLPISSRADAGTITDLVVTVLKRLRTSMVVVDEIHNLQTSRTIGAEAATALKLFSERLDATFVYAGIDLPTAELFTGEFGRQIKGRVILHQMRPYRFGTPSQQQAWVDLVELCEDQLFLTRQRPSALTPLAGYLFDRTGGSIGSLRMLLADAATDAILTGAERLTRAGVDATPTDRQASERRATTSAGPRPAAVDATVSTQTA